MPSTHDGRTQRALERCQHEYEQLCGELEDLGFVLPGSIGERWMKCGQPSCRCHRDPKARHGPYLQWTWNIGGKTRSVYLEPDQAALCEQWIRNNRQLTRLVTRMRDISMRAARLHRIAPK